MGSAGTDEKVQHLLDECGYDRAFTPLEDGVARYIRQFLATNEPRR